MKVQAQGGFVYFAQAHFSHAAELFYESRMDLREVRTSPFFTWCHYSIIFSILVVSYL